MRYGNNVIYGRRLGHTKQTLDKQGSQFRPLRFASWRCFDPVHLQIATWCLNINCTQVRNVSLSDFMSLLINFTTALFQCSITTSYCHRRFSAQRRNNLMQSFHLFPSMSRFLQINRHCCLHRGAVPACWDWYVHFLGKKYYCIALLYLLTLATFILFNSYQARMAFYNQLQSPAHQHQWLPPQP